MMYSRKDNMRVVFELHPVSRVYGNQVVVQEKVTE